ncbi:hypothetical protein [Klebsiella pasteurii]
MKLHSAQKAWSPTKNLSRPIDIKHEKINYSVKPTQQEAWHEHPE